MNLHQKCATCSDSTKLFVSWSKYSTLQYLSDEETEWCGEIIVQELFTENNWVQSQDLLCLFGIYKRSLAKIWLRKSQWFMTQCGTPKGAWSSNNGLPWNLAHTLANYIEQRKETSWWEERALTRRSAVRRVSITPKFFGGLGSVRTWFHRLSWPVLMQICAHVFK